MVLSNQIAGFSSIILHFIGVQKHTTAKLMLNIFLYLIDFHKETKYNKNN